MYKIERGFHGIISILVPTAALMALVIRNREKIAGGKNRRPPLTWKDANGYGVMLYAPETQA